MAIEQEKFFEIIREVSESKDLSSDNVLKKVRDKLKEKSDENGIDSPYTIVYNIFKSNSFYKNHEFKLQMPDGTTARGTLLHFAVKCGNALMVKLLLEHKVITTIKDHAGLTPLDIAISNSNQEIVQLLLDANANPKLEKNKDKTPRDIITKANEIPEDLVVKGNNATAALENGNKRTSLNSTDESSDSTVDEQYPRVNVKDIVKNFELPQKINATYSNEQTSISLNESSSSNDSGIFTESEDGEDIDAKNEESKSHVTEYQSKLEALEKQNQKENQSLKQQIQDLESEKATLKDKLDKTKTKEVLLEKKQKELTELRSYVTGHETKLKQFNKENESLRQEIKSLENENTTLKGTTKTKTDEVSLEKTGKRQMCFLKVASVNLVTMLAVGAIFSIAFQLPVLLTIATFVVSALIASGVTYAISTKPDTELKEVDIGSAQRGVCKTSLASA